MKVQKGRRLSFFGIMILDRGNATTQISLNELCVIQFCQRAALLMRVPSQARRSVIFLGVLKSGGVFTPRATAFLIITREADNDWMFPYIVTAEHVVSGILLSGEAIYCRYNMKDGTVRTESLASAHWSYYPTERDDHRTDVAATALMHSTDMMDHDFIPLPEDGFTIGGSQKRFGLGSQVFAIGLFRSHFGQDRNIPIVRVGNISAMPEEPISTKLGFMDAYLIETRSIAGLSGSPVFVDEPPNPAPPGQLPLNLMSMMIVDPRFHTDPEAVQWYKYHLLGLIHGHFDIADLDIDSVVDDATGGRSEEHTSELQSPCR
jgi:hypothetical protein